MIREGLYDIHGLVAIRVVGRQDVLNEVDLHLRWFKVERLKAAADVTIEPYDAAPAASRVTVVDDYDYGDGVYHRAAARLWMKPQGPTHTYYMDRLQVPINLIVQHALLCRGLTFVHGAAVVISEKAVVFPAYPGTGKTTIVSALVKEGAGFLADDLCIVGEHTVYSYPQDLSVYPHHVPILGYSTRKMRQAFRRTALVDAIAAPLQNSTSNLGKLARVILSALRTPAFNVSPTDVFGAMAISSSAPLSLLAVLERSGTVKTLTAESADPSDLGSQASAVLWHEWHASFHDLLLYDALAESGRGTSGRMDAVAQLIGRAAARVNAERIRIPASWDNSTLVREFPAFWRDRQQSKPIDNRLTGPKMASASSA